MDVRKALKRFLRHHRSEGHSPKTIRASGQFVGYFADFLHSQGHSGDIDDLTADVLRAWLDHLREIGNAPKSVQTKASHIKAFSRWLVDEEWLQADPFRKVKRPKADTAPKETLDPAGVERLLAACNRKTATGARNFAIILLLYSSGLRASEVLGLHVDDIDSDRGLITVRRGKGGKFRVVP